MTTKRIRTSDILGSNYYTYELSSTKYTTALNSTITITCTCKNVYGDAVGSKSLTLYQNGTSKGSKTTNSSGIATWSITCSTAGLQKFNIEDTSIEVFVDDSKIILFEDDCSSADGLTNYGSSIAVRGADSTMTMTYDSTENAYKCSGNNNYYSMIPIPTLNNQKRYIIEADFKAQNITYNGIGLCLHNSTSVRSYAVWIEPWDNKVIEKLFNLNSDGMISTHDNLSFDSSKWYHIKFVLEEQYLTWGVYDEDVEMIGGSNSYDYNRFFTENKQIGIILLTQNGTTDSTCYVKNIKAEALSEDISDSILYTTEELELATPTTSSNVTYKYKNYSGSDATLTFSTLNHVSFPYPSLPDFNSHTSVEIVFDIEFPNEEFIIILGETAIFTDSSDLMCGGFTDYQYADYNLYEIDYSLNNTPSQLIIQISSSNRKLLFNGKRNGETTILNLGYLSEISYSDNINIKKVTAKSLNFPPLLSRFIDDIPKMKPLPNGANLNSLHDNMIYLGSQYQQIENCPVENKNFILINKMLLINDNYAGQQQILMTVDNSSYGDVGTELWMRYYYQTGGYVGTWVKFVSAADLDMDQINLFASKQKLDENENFTIFANVKDNDGNPIANKSLTLMQQYDTYSNPDMSATGWVRDVGFYVNDTIFKGDWSCSFTVNSTVDHTGLQLYISSEQRILFSTLGATSTSEIEITCNDNTITINVDGTDYGTTYTQNSNGTKVGFFTHEDYSVSIKDFVVNSGMLYKDCGSQTTDSNGNCSWSFNDGLSKGLYSFSIDNIAVNVFVGLFVDTEPVELVVTYTDDTTETISLLKYLGN